MFARKSRNRLRRSLGLMALVAAAAGCGGGGARPDTWEFIAPAIIEPNCATASCHSEAAQRAGVVLEPRDTAFKTLRGRQFVIPMHPEDSELMALIQAQGSQRMPPDAPLPQADIELIERWINDGAIGPPGVTP